MITKDNKTLYANLFKKANDLLGLTDDNKKIKSIDDYFCHLGDITKLVVNIDEAGNMNITDPLFFILPVDEPTFNINANTRTITVPDVFKNGVSVKGDEIAETIYFTIDRYFDTTDFYDPKIKAVVQWQNANGDKNISMTTAKAVIEDQSEGTVKVIFGWPLSREITERDGNVTFSVRFYNTEKENDTDYLEYSWSTLNTTIKINPSLDLDIIEGGFDTVDKNWLIYQRLRNSLPADINLQAIQPIIDYLIPLVGSTADLDEIDNKLVVKFKATYPSGTADGRIGKQIYTLMREDYNGLTEVVSAAIDDDVFGESYEKTNDTQMNTTEIYYIKDGNEYIPYTDPDWPTDIQLYEKVYTYEVDTAGEYYIVITNFIDNNNKMSITSGRFQILLPTKPLIYGESESSYYGILEPILDEDNVETGRYNPCTLKLIVEDTDGGSPLTYKWYKAETADGEKSEIIGANESTYDAEEAGYYFLQAINRRNNSEAIEISKPIRVTKPAEKPIITYRSPLGPVNESILVENGLTVNIKLTAEATTESNQDGQFIYAWYKVNSSGGNDILISTEQSITFNDSQAGNRYYCEVKNIYNKISEATAKGVVFSVISNQ